MTRKALAAVRPSNRMELRGWLRAVLGIEVPGNAREHGHGSPLDYLEHVFFEHEGDAVVWANRGGGKTFYGAVATLLDLIFKPGIEIRILGGSMEQSRKMHSYLRWMIEQPGLVELVDGKINERGLRLLNGSVVELLAQSQTSVRGHRVQKLRCDEVELFDRDVWEAAQFVTRSKMCGDIHVRGTVEALSTAHRPLGLMSELIDAARDDSGKNESSNELRNDETNTPATNGWALFCWNALDVMGTCEPERECASCLIEPSCGGLAKTWAGFLSVEDVLSQRRRSSSDVFAAEMLCKRASRRDAVFSSFEPDVHVRDEEPQRWEAGPGGNGTWIGGMDFGMRNPFVMLWAQVQAGGRRVVVFDEYIQSDGSVDRHMATMDARPWPRVKWVGADPAGLQREQTTGDSVIGALRESGWCIRTRRTRLAPGLETVQRWLENTSANIGGNDENESKESKESKESEASSRDNGGGGGGLIIHPRCKQLIKSLTCYHFDMDDPQNPNPVKDGYDHAADALRYMLVNLENSGEIKTRNY